MDDSTSTIKTAGGLEPGDIITFSGQFKKRTFWQWIKREQKQLERYVVKDTSGDDATIYRGMF